MKILSLDSLSVANAGVTADFGGESEDDEWERKQLEDTMKILEAL